MLAAGFVWGVVYPYETNFSRITSRLVKRNMADRQKNFLYLKRLGIDTLQEPVVYMRKDCHVCRSEGFNALSRVRVSTDKQSIIATLHQVSEDWLSHQHAGLSEAAWRLLDAEDLQIAHFSHTRPVDSMSFVRGKLYGNPLDQEAIDAVIDDITTGRYSDVQLAAFVTACAGSRLDESEVAGLTRAMVNAGKRIDWGEGLTMDKHCVGGLPGNRTTPIVVAIVTACGLRMPKTSSRAITSPAGTADTMEVLAPVNLSLKQMQQVVEKEGGCIAWGGSVSLSPADDILIRIERALDLDSEGQLVASVLSKKVAAGSTHVLIDIPVGTTAKVRSRSYARRLAKHLHYTGERLGLHLQTYFSDGSQPVGFGIGPALEARDLVAVFNNREHAPTDLKDRALMLAGNLLEMGNRAPEGMGLQVAKQCLESGAAWQKFLAICEAQGGYGEPPVATHTYQVAAENNGVVAYINNRFIAKLAKLAGAPGAAVAGVDFHVKLGQKVSRHTPLFTIHAEARGELEYALEFLNHHPGEIRVEEEGL